MQQHDTRPKTIETLQSLRHRMSDNHKPSLFEDANTTNTAEYWIASDLYNVLPGTIPQPPNNIPEYLYRMANTPQIHEILATKNTLLHFYQIISQNADVIKYAARDTQHPNAPLRNNNDARLSRFACFVLAYNAKNSPITHLAMAYFMRPGATNPEIIQTTDDIERATERIRCQNLERVMCGIISAANNTPIGIIYDRMHNIFMGNISAAAIRCAYNIKDTSTLNNYMDGPALCARNNAIARAITRMDRAHQQTDRTFINILSDEMSTAREVLFRQTGRNPESHITPTHIKTCQATLTSMRLNLVDKYILDDIRQK